VNGSTEKAGVSVDERVAQHLERAYVAAVTVENVVREPVGSSISTWLRNLNKKEIGKIDIEERGY